MVVAPMLADLFPREVVTVEATEAMGWAPLHPEEEACLGHASERRLREFRAGRACARAALERLGLPGFPVGRRADRTPSWPPGIVGCIAHTAGCCAAAVARETTVAGLGLDVERTGRIREALLPRIGSPGEIGALARLARRSEAAATDWPTVLFSAKESVFKCYYPLARTFLGFHDVEVAIDPEQESFTARLVRADAPGVAGARVLHGRFAGDGGRVFTGVTLPARTRVGTAS
jgi:4'-phosphopantetheinyl transferase EntD